MKSHEITIPVPWGVIAAKVWGDENDPPIICLHGWMDNANSFDCLIPQLPASFYYMCIDLPGHGYSTQLSNSVFLHALEYILVLKIILDELKRNQYILMGHSLGGQTAILFTQMYPSYVQKLIMLDTSYYKFRTAKSYVNSFYTKINLYYKLQGEAHEMTMEQALQRIRQNRSVLSRKSAEILAQRSLVETGPNKYKFSMAKQLPYILIPDFTLPLQVQLARCHPINCPHLIVIASENLNHKFAFKLLHDEFQKNMHFECHVVHGTHDVHLEHAERVAPILFKFLMCQHNKL